MTAEEKERIRKCYEALDGLIHECYWQMNVVLTMIDEYEDEFIEKINKLARDAKRNRESGAFTG